MTNIFPVEVWYEIKKYLSDLSQIQNVSTNFRQIFIDEHFIDRIQHYETFKKSFVPKFKVSPLVDRLISDLQTRIDSDNFFHYCDLLLQNRNEILVTFKLIHPCEENYENNRYVPTVDFFDRTIFLLMKSNPTSFQDGLITAYDNNKHSSAYFEKKIGSNLCETINFATRKLSVVLKYKSSFYLLSKQHFFPQSDDVMIRLFQFFDIKQLKNTRFVNLPETDENVKQLFENQHSINHPVDIFFPISPFDWDTFFEIKNRLFQTFTNFNVIISFLLCKHLPHFVDLKIKWNNNVLLPYQVLNMYPWKRIKLNITTLINFHFSFATCAQYAYHLLTLHPNVLKARCDFLSRNLFNHFNQTKKLILLNLSIEKLVVIETEPKLLRSSKNVSEFYYFVNKLQESPIYVLNELRRRSMFPKSSNFIPTLNFLYFANQFEPSDFIDRFNLMKKNPHWFDIPHGGGFEFYYNTRVHNYRIIFDKEKFPTYEAIKSKLEFVDRERKKLIINWYQLMEATFCYIPNDILTECLSFYKSLSQTRKCEKLLLINVLSKFSDDEFIVGWNAMKQIQFDLSFVISNVRNLSDLLNLAHNLTIPESSSLPKHKLHLLVKKGVLEVINFVKNNFENQIAEDLFEFNIEQLKSMIDYKSHLKKFPQISHLQNQPPDEIVRVLEMFVNNEIK